MIFGMFVSLVMQQGDCNAPSTFQMLMTVVFRDNITCFVHIYLDDIFIYSSSIEEHEKHLELVFNKLCEVVLGKFGPGLIGTRSGPDQTLRSRSRSGIFLKTLDRLVSGLGIPILPETVSDPVWTRTA